MNRVGDPPIYGYTLSSEEQDPAALVSYAQQSEESGFEFASISDHFHPWISEQGHSPFVWSVLGAIAVSTQRIRVGTGVTCPIVRMHPAVIAHAVATTSLLFDGRFFFGVGSGEALNEHVVGARWPPAPVRLEMLEESIGIIRELLTGETVDREGRFYRVENARLFDPPTSDVPIFMSGFGPNAAALAGRIGDGYFGTSPDHELLEAYERDGGEGPRYAQLSVCWAPTEAAARETVHRVWPNAALEGQLSQDLPTWTHFEQATSILTPEQTTQHVPCGPDIVEAVTNTVKQYVDAGYDHLSLHQIGPQQDGFLQFWREELAPALGVSV